MPFTEEDKERVIRAITWAMDDHATNLAQGDSRKEWLLCRLRTIAKGQVAYGLAPDEAADILRLLE